VEEYHSSLRDETNPDQYIKQLLNIIDDVLENSQQDVPRSEIIQLLYNLLMKTHREKYMVRILKKLKFLTRRRTKATLGVQFLLDLFEQCRIPLIQELILDVLGI
jgi:hypothetical protein